MAAGGGRVSQHSLGKGECVYISQHALGGGGIVSAQGVGLPGVSAQERGVCPSACWDRPPVDRMTDACENITLPQLRCGR